MRAVTSSEGWGLFHDNPQMTSPELLRYDACVEARSGLNADPAAGICRQVLSGGTYAGRWKLPADGRAYIPAPS